jgi:hypothetical protein
LLSTACPRILPSLAIGGFAGIRIAEISRLDWEDIDLNGGFIEVKARNAKTSTRRIVKIMPCLAAWLRPFAQESGLVMPSLDIFNWHRRHLLKKAGIAAWPDNALRHSFASYHIAHFRDAASLALEMGHSTTKMIFEHYREVVRPDVAAQFFAIAPSSQPETKHIFALTPEAYNWHVQVYPLSPKSGKNWKGKYKFVCWKRIGMPELAEHQLFETKEEAQTFADRVNEKYLAKLEDASQTNANTNVILFANSPQSAMRSCKR